MIILSSILLVSSRPRGSISLHYCDRSSRCSALWQFGRWIGKYQCFQPFLTQTSLDNNLIYLSLFIFCTWIGKDQCPQLSLFLANFIDNCLDYRNCFHRHHGQMDCEISMPATILFHKSFHFFCDMD